jgi:hypothetical protein
VARELAQIGEELVARVDIEDVARGHGFARSFAGSRRTGSIWGRWLRYAATFVDSACGEQQGMKKVFVDPMRRLVAGAV